MTRLVSKDVKPRLTTELNKRVSVGGGVMKFGEKDDYPNTIEKIVSSSVTAVSAANIYARFLTGGGFEDETINNYVIGQDNRGKNITIQDLLRLASESVSYYNGFYWHVSLNVDGLIKDPKLISFKHCRFTKLDDLGYTSSIAVNKNFGRDKKFKPQETVTYPVFNNRPEVVQSQIKAAGGMDKYKGQIYFQYWDNRYLYPLSPFDPVYLDADTEWQLSLYKNRELRNGFMLRHILRVAKFESEENLEAFVKQIEDTEGGDGSRIMVLEDEYDQDTGEIKESGAFKIDSIDSNVNDKLFENWELSLSNNIRKANKALPAILIDYESSKLGNTSGEAIKQASMYYNEMTKDDRQLMSQVFKEVFSSYVDEEIRNKTNWNIKPLQFESVEPIIKPE